MAAIKKCAVCGNKDKSNLFDEDKYVYCSVCKMRTKKSDGKAYVVKCMFCGRKTCGNTISCMFCGNPLDPTEKPSKAEKKENRKVVDDFEKTLSPFTLNKVKKRYWKYSFKRRKLVRICCGIVALAIIIAVLYFVL